MKLKIRASFSGMLQSKMIFLFIIMMHLNCTDFNKSKKNEKLNRVEIATLEKKDSLIKKLESFDIHWDKVNVFIRAFKREKVLEIWAKNNTDVLYQKVIEYDFCKMSGVLGPKRKEGDGQVPEGLYHIDRFNSKSNFYLSLGLNYPNKSDKLRGDKNKPGNDIFIHGACVTVGCIPITDDKIKELYILAEHSKNNGQTKIQVNIYPTRLTQDNLEILKLEHPKQIDFWKELKVFYDVFEETKALPKFKIAKEGNYILM